MSIKGHPNKLPVLTIYNIPWFHWIAPRFLFIIILLYLHILEKIIILQYSTVLYSKTIDKMANNNRSVCKPCLLVCCLSFIIDHEKGCQFGEWRKESKFINENKECYTYKKNVIKLSLLAVACNKFFFRSELFLFLS